MARPRKCPVCPACGQDDMRQYGGSIVSGHVKRMYYACQSCQHTAVWREVDGKKGRWEKKPSDNSKNLPTTS